VEEVPAWEVVIVRTDVEMITIVVTEEEEAMVVDGNLDVLSAVEVVVSSEDVAEVVDEDAETVVLVPSRGVAETCEFSVPIPNFGLEAPYTK
jgi:hypothetical protein